MGIGITGGGQSAHEEAGVVSDESEYDEVGDNKEDEAVDKEEEIESSKTAKVINC